jgi:nucleotide-binding universal stress UspA family protein
MFEHIVVPLDGSRLAEAVLPAAAHLASVLPAKVTLLHLIERNPPDEIHGERHLTDEAEAYAYLEEIAERAFPPGVEVEKHVHTTEVRDVARSIVEHGSELGNDLIAMCTHGSSELRDRLLGSIALQVIAMGVTPVLLVHPEKTDPSAAFTCQRMLVPLDGDPDHEQALQVAADLARACQAELHMLMIVPTLGTLPGEQAATATLLPGSTNAMLDMAEESAQEYLKQARSRLQVPSLPLGIHVQRGDPARQIVDTALETKADLIVMGTHGKRSMDAFWSGSVTPKVAGRAPLPLLLVPVGASGSPHSS